MVSWCSCSQRWLAGFDTVVRSRRAGEEAQCAFVLIVVDRGSFTPPRKHLINLKNMQGKCPVFFV